MATSVASTNANNPSDNIKVAVKVRPLIKRERDAKLNVLWTVKDHTIKSLDKQHNYSFDFIFDEKDTTQLLYETVAKPIVKSTIKGFNGTIFAYGQTSSGKTHTMIGNEEEPGIVLLAVRDIFNEISTCSDRVFLIRIGYIEIYNEKINDLFDKKAQDIKVYEGPNGEININQKEIIVNSEEDILNHFEAGNKLKQMGETAMNERSSRSHTIFRIIIESSEASNADNDGAIQISHLNLVDLAGSERPDQTGSTGNRFKEGVSINKSLLSLGMVIKKLSEMTEPSFVNYRDSKLTRILQQSLGGNALSAIICTVTPAVLEETYSTLCFGLRAQKIINKPEVNENLSESVMMKRLQKEITRLQEQLKVEQQKNDLLNCKQLENQISEREKQFLYSSNVTSHKVFDPNRRKTWCSYSSMATEKVDDKFKSSIPQIVKSEALLRPPKSQNYLDLPPPAFFMRSGDERRSEEDAGSDKTLSPSNSEKSFQVMTPETFKNRLSNDSPDIRNYNSKENLMKRIKYLETEIAETKDFKQVELISIQKDLREKETRIHSLEEKNFDMQNDLIAKADLLDAAEKRINDLELVSEERLNEMEAEIKKLRAELKDALRQKLEAFKERDQAKSMLAGVEYTIEQNKTLWQKREKELIESLNEARGEKSGQDLHDKLKSMEENLKKLEQENFNLTKSLDEANELMKNLQMSVENFQSIQIESDKYKLLIDTLSNNLIVQEKLSSKTPKNDLIKFVKIVRDFCFPDNLMNGDDLEIDETFGEDVSPSVPKIVVSSPAEIELSNLRAENEKLRESNGKSKAEMHRLNMEYDELSTQLMDAVQDSDDLKLKCQQLQEENQEFSSKLQLLEETNQELQGKMTEFQLICEKLSEIQEQLDQSESPQDSSNKNLKTLNNLINKSQSLQEKCHQLEEEQKQMMQKQDLEDFENKFKESQENCQHLQEELSEIQNEMEVVKKNLENSASIKKSDDSLIEMAQQEIEEMKIKLNAKLVENLQLILEKEALEIRLQRCEDLLEDERDIEEYYEPEEISEDQEVFCKEPKVVFKMLEMISEVPELTPEKSKVTPKKPEVTPEKAEVTPKKPDVTPKKAETTPVKPEVTHKDPIIDCSVIESSLLEKQESPDDSIGKLMAELSEKTAKIKELEDSIASREQEIENEIGGLKSGLKDIMRFELENSRLKSIEKEFQTLKKNLEWKQKECAKNLEEITKLESANNKLKEEIEKNQEKLEEFKESFDKFHAIKNLLDSFDGSIENRIKNLLEIVGEKTQKLGSLENLIKNLIASKSLENCKLEDDDQQKEEMMEKIQELETLIAKQTEEIEKKSVELEEANTKMEATALEAQKLEEATEKIQEMENRIENLQKESDNVLVMEDLSSKLEEAYKKIQELEETNEKIYQENQKIEKLEAELRDLQEAERKIQELQEENQKIEILQGEILKLQEECKKLDEATEKIKELQEENLKLQESKENDKKLSEAEQRILDLEETNKRIKEVEEENRKLEELKEKLEESEKKLGESQENLENAQKMLEQSQGNLEETQRNLEESRGKVEATQEELEEARGKLEATQEELEAILKKLEENQGKLKTFEENLEKSEKKIKDFSEKIEKLQVENSRIQELEEVLEKVTVAKSTTDGRVLELEKLLESAEIRHEKLEESLRKVQNDKDLVEQQMVELANTLTNIQKSFKDEENDLENYKELKMEKSLVESQKSALEAANSALESNKQSLEAENSELLEKISALEKALETGNLMVSDYQVKIAELEKEWQTQSSKIALLELQISQEQEELDTVSKNNEILTKQLAEKSTDNQTLKEALNKLDAENTNKHSSLILKDEKIKELEKALTEKTSEYQEFKVRYKRRSFDVDVKISNLEMQINDLIQKNGAIQLEKSSVEAEMKKLKNEHLYLIEKQVPELRKQNEELSERHSKFAKEKMDLEVMIQNLEEKCRELTQDKHKEHAQLLEENAELKKKVETQISENFVHNQTIAQMRTANGDISKQLEELKGMHIFKVNQLQREIEEKTVQLQKLQSNKDDEDFHHKHKVTFDKDMRKDKEKDSVVNTVKNLSKIRRQSTHDERRLSLWEKFQEVGTMTDPVNELCGCSEKNERITELIKQCKLKDCRVTFLEFEKKNNPLQCDLDEEKKASAKVRKESDELRRDFKSLTKQYKQLENKCITLDSENSQMRKMLQKTKVTQYTQTDTEINLNSNDLGIVGKAYYEKLQSDYNLLKKKYEDTKKIAKLRNEKIQELEKGKENQSSNANHSGELKRLEEEIIGLKKTIVESEEKINNWKQLYYSKTANHSLEKKTNCVYVQTDNEKFDKLEADLKLVSQKYDQAKFSYHLRVEELEAARAEAVKFKSELNKVSQKYTIAKNLCQIRNNELKVFRETYGPLEIKNGDQTNNNEFHDAKDN